MFYKAVRSHFRTRKTRHVIVGDRKPATQRRQIATKRTNIIIRFAKRIAISIAALLDRKTGKSLHFATCTEAIYQRVITKLVLDA